MHHLLLPTFAIGLLIINPLHLHHFANASPTSTNNNTGLHNDNPTPSSSPCFQNEHICHAIQRPNIHACCPEDKACCAGRLSVACCAPWQCFDNAGPRGGYAICEDQSLDPRMNDNAGTGTGSMEKGKFARREREGVGRVIVVEGVALLRAEGRVVEKAHGHARRQKANGQEEVGIGSQR